MSTEITLIKRTLDGETEAFGQLVMQYQQQIYRLIYRIIGNTADAQDITQEVFIKAYQNLETLKDPRCFQAWLMKIARNRCYNWIRERQDNLFSLDQEMVEYHPFASLEGRPMQFPPAPDEVIIKEELYEQVMSAISELPEKDKRVIELFYLEEKSYQEIQQELGISKSVLGWRLSNARAKLRQKLQAVYQGIFVFLSDNANRISKIFSVEGTNSITVSVAKYLFVSVMVHLTLFMTASVLVDISWFPQNGGNYSEELMPVALLSSASVPDLSFPSFSLPIGTQNRTTQRRNTKASPIPDTRAIPINQAILNLAQVYPIKIENQLDAQTKSLPEPSLFLSVPVMKSLVNGNVPENILHNKPAQLILQKMANTPFGQGFQGRTDLLALVGVYTQAVTVADGPLVTEPAKKKSLSENECGAIVIGNGLSMKGQAHIAKPIYQKGGLWVKPGMPEGLLKWFNERTEISLRVLPEKFQISSEQLFKQPFLLVSGDSELVFSQKDEDNLQKYLIEKGGFLFITYSGKDLVTKANKKFDDSVRALLKRVLPKHSLAPLSPQHEICTYGYSMGPPTDFLEEISIEERLAVLYSPTNYWNALSNLEPEDLMKLRFATNIIRYALTHGKISDYSGYKPK